MHIVLGKGDLVAMNAMKAYDGIKVLRHSFLVSAQDGVCNELHAPAALPQGNNTG